MKRIQGLLFVCLLALVPGLSSAEANRALAGQNVTKEIDGGQQTKEYARNGTLIYEVIERELSQGNVKTIQATEREWRDDGTPVREQEFLGGKEMKATFWYMNGKVKEARVDQSTHDPKGVPGTYIERFSDLGALQSSGVVQGQFRPVGVHRLYNEAGTLISEVTYGPDGTKLSSKTFDASGAAKDQTQYYPDGSRKTP